MSTFCALSYIYKLTSIISSELPQLAHSRTSRIPALVLDISVLIVRASVTNISNFAAITWPAAASLSPGNTALAPRTTILAS